MFKRLKIKFLLLHMGIVLLLIFLFFSVLFTITYKNVERMSEDMLLKAVNTTFKPIPPVNESHIKPKVAPIITIVFDDAGVIENITGFNSFSNEFYENIVALARNNDSNDIIRHEGAYFKFKEIENKMFFLDVSKEFQMLFNMLITFLAIAIPVLFIVFLISFYFANKAIKPIEESYNKQQEFISDASHELKTPLTTISTNADLLLNSATGEQLKWLTYIKSETKRMVCLTESLLYLTKMDYQNKMEAEKFKLDELLNDLFLPLEAVFYEKNIKLETKILSNVIIIGEKEQIRRMVNIFLDNAIKYTDEKVKITLSKTQSNAVVEVFNTGEGIKKEDILKIWDRFYRCDKSRKYTGGFGLGLPIANSIIIKHKGTVLAQSEYTKWTKFIIKLPLAK